MVQTAIAGAIISMATERLPQGRNAYLDDIMRLCLCIVGGSEEKS
jgi:hypothetical protein